MCGKLSQVCSATMDSTSIFYSADPGCGTIRRIMRRIFATFLVAIMAVGGLLPLAIAATGDTTPVCCRKDGKHHCQMSRVRQESSPEGLPRAQGSASDCPFHEQVGTLTVSVAVVPQSGAVPRLAVSGSYLLRNIVLLSSEPISFGTLRGPPFLS